MGEEFDSLCEKHEMLALLCKQAFRAYRDSLAPPRTSSRCGNSKVLEVAYNSAKAAELEAMEKITNMF